MIGSRFRNLDFLRGVSILLVLGAHCPAHLIDIPFFSWVSPFFETFGGYGVDIFFAISGYLIGGDLINQKLQNNSIDFKEFYLRRYLKILPPFYVCLVANILLYLFFSKDYSAIDNVWENMLPAFFNVQNYFPSTSLFAWFWSLAVEEHFYLFLPIVILALKISDKDKMRKFFLLFVFVATVCFVFRAVGWWFFPEPNGYTHKFPTHLRVDGLLIGVFVSTLRTINIRVLGLVVLFFFSVLIFALAAFPLKNGPCEFLLTSLGAGIFVFLVNKLDQAQFSIKSLGLISLVGRFTYSIYLWHGFLAAPIALRILEKIGYKYKDPGLASFLHLMLYFFVSISIGVFMYFALENPIVKIRNSLLRRSEKR